MKMNWRKVTIILACVLLTVVAVFALLTSSIWYPGITPMQTAQILIKDYKFGWRGLGMAHFWGDAILVPLRKVSKDFTLLDHRSSFWVAEILAKNGSTASLEMSLELYKRKRIYEKLVGAVGLAAHGKLPNEEFLPNGFIYDLLTNDKYIYKGAGIEKGTRDFADTSRVELALVVTKYARNEHSVLPIMALIEKRPMLYMVHARACEALAEIGDRRAIPVLESAMEADNFYALPEAFRLLPSWVTKKPYLLR